VLNKEIPFSRPFINDDEINEVSEVLRGKWITTGKKVKEFEDKVKEYLDVDMAIAVSSGTAAIDVSLAVNNICSDDEIITTPYTFASTILSIIHRGAHPVLIDVDKETFNLDPIKVLAYIKKNYKKTRKGLLSKIRGKYLRGIIIVHFGGQSVELDELNNIAKANNIFIIEDAAHAIGSEYKGVKIGNSNNAVCFSFYSNKNITTGEGGMIVKKNNKNEELYRKYSLHGISKSNIERYKTGLPFYDIEVAGFKNNLTDIQAALGVVQMRKIDYITKQRNIIAEWYDEELKNISEIELPIMKKYNYSARHLYPILLKPELKDKRDELILKLRENNIYPSVHFRPVHFFSYFKKYYLEEEINNLKIAEDLFYREISLPIFPEINREEVKKVANVLKKLF